MHDRDGYGAHGRYGKERRGPMGTIFPEKGDLVPLVKAVVPEEADKAGHTLPKVPVREGRLADKAEGRLIGRSGETPLEHRRQGKGANSGWNSGPVA
ncbi:MAG: hypothetical protein MZV63_47050 [Marinilabiliales bacterium]|nr:hypothetical protein [Marinilabiliales bacterium]